MRTDTLDMAENSAQPRLPARKNRFLQGGSPAMEKIPGALDSGAERELMLSTLSRARWNANARPRSFRSATKPRFTNAIGEESTVTAGAAE